MKTRIAILAVMVLAARTWAGPVVVDGTAANNFGSGDNVTNQRGWLYMQKVLESLSDQLSPTGIVKVVVSLGATSGQASNAIESAFQGSKLPGAGWKLIHIDGADGINGWLRTLSKANTGILYIPTASLTEGDLQDVELDAVNSGADSIKQYTGSGGGLFAMGERPVDAGVVAFGWLKSILKNVTPGDVGAAGVTTPLALTAQGQISLPGMTDADLTGQTWYNYFAGILGLMQPLATGQDGNGVSRNVIIGGNSGFSTAPAFETCQPVTVPSVRTECVTRTARFWFTHVYSANTNCATLLKAIEASTNAAVCLGFLKLPQFYENGDNVKDAVDATIEAMGFYWRSDKYTGETRGVQSAGLKASPQCRARKALSVELIAAIANNVLLGTLPGNCSANFPSDLIEQAGQVASGDDYLQMKTMTVLLRQFNSSNVTNQLPFGLEECSDYGSKKTLKSVSRDPTMHYSCPGNNDSCDSAAPVFFTHTGDIFNRALFQDKVSLNTYQNDFGVTECAMIGKYAMWRIGPAVAVAGRRFTVTTYDSSFDTVVAVLKGTDCGEVVIEDCNDNSPLYPPTSVLTFTADGNNNYYILVGNGASLPGRLKVKIASP